MSLHARRELLNSIRQRYIKADRTGKGAILDEFVKATGCGRKHAIGLLNKPPSETGRPRGKGRSTKYGEDVRQALIELWRISNEICSKRLIPFLPDLIEVLERKGRISLTNEIRQQLLELSPGTADKLLAGERKAAARSKTTTRPGSLLKRQIPIRTFAEWNDVIPGFFEADLVAHCGSSVEGMYLNSLVLTDITTGWTECFALLHKTEFEVIKALKKAANILPVPILGFDSDNGGEFINYSLVGYCNRTGITFTRSRSYKKNDQAHVEEKNGSVVRRTVGYSRFEGTQAQEALQRLYDVLRLYVNCFQPSMKLVSKEQDGVKVSRTYDKAQTPYRRMLTSPAVSEEAKQRLREIYHQLDPAQLNQDLQYLQDELWKYATKPAPKLSASTMVASSNAKALVEAYALRQTEAAKTTGRERRYRQDKPRKVVTWRTRKDPFEMVAAELRMRTQKDPKLTAGKLLVELKRRFPGQYTDNQIRTLHRRVVAWRAALAPAALISDTEISITGE